MTVEELKGWLATFPDNLEILVRCTWEGDEPSSNVFEPRVLVQDADHDTAAEFVAIECDQCEPL